jgi:hypothetical protein
MFEEKDFDDAIDTIANLKIYINRITSKELDDAIDLVGCLLTESKERLFPVERS